MNAHTLYQLKETASTYRELLIRGYDLSKHMIRSLERESDYDMRTWKALARRGLVEKLPPIPVGELLWYTLGDLTEEGKEVAATLKLIKRLCG